MTPERIAELRLYAEGITRHAGGAELRKILFECLLEIEFLQAKEQGAEGAQGAEAQGTRPHSR